jgi:hypothetical protein
LQYTHQSLRLAALSIDIDIRFFLRFFDSRMNKLIDIGKGGTTHRAFSLLDDHALDASVPERVFAGCDDRVVQSFETDGTFVAAVDAELKDCLEGEAVFGIELDDVFGIEDFEKVGDAVAAAELPVAADLTEAEEDLEEVAVGVEAFAVSLPLSGLVFLQHSFCFSPNRR